MSLLYFDGFESQGNYGLNQTVIEQANPAGAIASDIVRSGNKSLKLQTITSNGSNKIAFRHSFTNDSTVLIVGFAIYFGGSNQQNDLYFFRMGESGGSRFHSLNLISPVNKIVLIDSIDGTIGTFNTSIGRNSWYYIQIRSVIHSINGEVTVLLGNQEEIHITERNFSCNNNCFNCIDIRHQTWADSPTYFDDIYVCNGDGTENNDFMGIARIVGGQPTAAGDRTDFEVVGSNNVVAVNEYVPETASYVYGDNINEKMLWHFPDFTSIGSIKSIKITDYAARSVEGQGVGKYRHIIRLNDVDYDSTDMLLNSGTFGLHTTYQMKNPETDELWSEENLNSTQIGVKVTQVD